MDSALLLGFTGLSVGALYFLLASGLSLVFGLMHVLSFAHGAFLSVCAYAAWIILDAWGTDGRSGWELILACVLATVVGGVIALLTELLLLRPLYKRDNLDQLLVTLGLGFVIVAILRGIWGPEERQVSLPDWVKDTTALGGANIPNDRFIIIGAAILVFVLLQLILRKTRHGTIVRAGVENRDMVRALGIDVRHSFTLVFTLGGMAAGLAGALGAMYLRAVQPGIGDHFILFAFIVLIVGGLGSLSGALVAAVVVGLVQQFANFYIGSGAGDVITVALMAVMLLVRPQGLFGRTERVA
jgi:branched-chain amino acid transport system permease protein